MAADRDPNQEDSAATKLVTSRHSEKWLTRSCKTKPEADKENG